MCKCTSVARRLWYLDSYREVAISVISVGMTSVDNSIKINMNFSSQRKFRERDRQDFIWIWEDGLFGFGSAEGTGVFQWPTV